MQITNSQLQVIWCMARGITGNEEIARKLGISKSSVDIHRNALVRLNLVKRVGYREWQVHPKVLGK
jgi:DNA-binding CsgD family transcriptional regulator